MPILRSLTFVVAATVLGGCPASSDDVRPPDDQFYFPTGMALSPDESELFVINANSDLRFDSGTLVTVDVDAVEAIVEAWSTGTPPPGRDCAPDAGFPITLICSEREVINAERSVRIGNFATEIGVQELDSGDLRLFLAVRGDPSLTYIDVIGSSRPRCDSSEDLFAECDEDFRLVQLRDDEDLPALPEEPFGIYVDGPNGYAMTTHLSSGTVTLANAPLDGSPPVLADAIGGLFIRNQQNGALGAVGAAGRLPGTADNRVYITSRGEARVQTLLVDRSQRTPILVAGEFFFLDRVLPSDDGRDISFRSDGNRAYVINRDPPMLQIIDTSLSPTGVPLNEFDGSIELCRQAVSVESIDFGGGERLYVTCFQDGQLWTIDPVGREVESIADVGRGPQFLIPSQSRGLLFVSNFRESTVAVVDARQGSPTEGRVILRLGRVNETEGI